MWTLNRKLGIQEVNNQIYNRYISEDHVLSTEHVYICARTQGSVIRDQGS